MFNIKIYMYLCIIIKMSLFMDLSLNDLFFILIVLFHVLIYYFVLHLSYIFNKLLQDANFLRLKIHYVI